MNTKRLNLLLLFFTLLSINLDLKSEIRTDDPPVILMDFSVERILDNESILISITIFSSVDIEDANINFILPGSIVPMKGSLNNKVKVFKGIPTMVSLEAKSEIKTNFKIKGVFYAMINHSKVSIVKYSYFEYNDNVLSYLPNVKTSQQNLGLKSSNPELLQYNSFNQLKSSTTFISENSDNVLSSDTASIKGSIRFKDSKGDYQSLQYAKIELIAKKADGYKILFTTNTNETGIFNIKIPIDPALTNVNVFIRVATVSAFSLNEFLESGIDLLDNVFKKPYYAMGETFKLSDAISQKKNIEINIDEDVNTGACAVFQNSIDALLSSNKQLGIMPPKATVIWPSGSTVTTDTIYIMQYDRWDKDVVFHEYAHFLDFNYNLTKRATGNHYFDENLSERFDSIYAKNLAFSEGCATFWAVSLQYAETKDTYYDDTEDVEIHANLDGPIKHKGEDCAGAVACILWDIFDANSEDFDQISLGLKSIKYYIFEETPTTNIRKFVGKYEAKEPATYLDIIPIYNEYTGINLLTGLENLSQTGSNSIDLVCYPNPFKNDLTINYTLKEKGFVQLDIYNNLGQKIKTLVAENQDKMILHTIKWNRTYVNDLNVPSGFYYIVIRQNNNMRTKKLQLLK